MYIRFSKLAVSVLSFSVICTGTGLAQTTELISVDSLGVQGNSTSQTPSISADGRFIAFTSAASNLVPADTNSTWDVFVHDRQTGVTEIVSVNSSGVQGNGGSDYASISADGRYVVFESYADNLVPNDTNLTDDIFVHDRQTGFTERVSVDSLGFQAEQGGYFPTISADGSCVVFSSYSENLVPGDTNLQADIFVHELQTGVTERVSLNSQGAQANSWSMWPASLSADGRYVAFQSIASNLVPWDTNQAIDIFVRDRQTGVTKCASVDSLGTQGNGDSFNPSLSADGRYVAFQSEADYLVPGDTNWFSDIFIHDRQTGFTNLVSVNSHGEQGNSLSNSPSISPDGKSLAFTSRSSNLVPKDTNGHDDAFVRNLQTGVTERVSVNAVGTQGYDPSYSPSMSADARYVAFTSYASNLVPRDINGFGDIFLHDRWDGLGENSIYLDGPTTAPVSAPISLSWQSTRGNSSYWLAYSHNMNGAVIGGHNFDIGLPVVMLATGINTTNGMGSFTSQPVPPSAAGKTLLFEVAARDSAGVLFDSNMHSVTFF